jgi:tRNA-splicing ligase RtcB
MTRWNGTLEKLDDNRYVIPKNYRSGMRVPGMVFASADMLEAIREEQALEQVVNVAFLPGIVGYSFAMPDIHWGYGFPIGGVAAMGLNDGVISPGGVGFDINCGVRILRINLTRKEVEPKMNDLIVALYNSVPSGVGSEGKIRIKTREIDEVLTHGSRWAVNKGFGRSEDLETTEEGGQMADCDPGLVSDHAKERGAPQLGTLGSGNHFLEVDVIDQIFDREAAGVMGINEPGQVVIWVHCGSRGLGHQVADDYIKEMISAMTKYGISLPDRQLACAPFGSAEGQAYLSAMRCAANYAWANRQCITHWVREAFAGVMGIGERDAGLELVYDVAHNIAKVEEHSWQGKKIKVCVHRKGATRAFPPGHPEIPAKYSKIGQPVLVPGDMGRYSYIMTGTEGAMQNTFGSTCHGAGRRESRSEAKRHVSGRDVMNELESRGIKVMAGSMAGLAEEASEAYKDVKQVVGVAQNAGIAHIVARTKPIGVIKG